MKYLFLIFCLITIFSLPAVAQDEESSGVSLSSFTNPLQENIANEAQKELNKALENNKAVLEIPKLEEQSGMSMIEGMGGGENEINKTFKYSQKKGPLSEDLIPPRLFNNIKRRY